MKYCPAYGHAVKTWPRRVMLRCAPHDTSGDNSHSMSPAFFVMAQHRLFTHSLHFPAYFLKFALYDKDRCRKRNKHRYRGWETEIRRKYTCLPSSIPVLIALSASIFII